MPRMTVNLSAAEMAVVEAMAKEQELSKTAVLRQALRLYQLADHRRRQGMDLSVLEGSADEKMRVLPR